MKNQTLMTTLELLDELKSLNNNASDYRAAQIIGVKPQTVSKWRTQGSIPDDDTAVRVADALGVQPEYVLACVHAERCKTPQARSAWLHIAAAFGTAAAFVFIAIIIAPSIQF